MEEIGHKLTLQCNRVLIWILITYNSYISQCLCITEHNSWLFWILAYIDVLTPDIYTFMKVSTKSVMYSEFWDNMTLCHTVLKTLFSKVIYSSDLILVIYCHIDTIQHGHVFRRFDIVLSLLLLNNIFMINLTCECE